MQTVQIKSMHLCTNCLIFVIMQTVKIESMLLCLFTLLNFVITQIVKTKSMLLYSICLIIVIRQTVENHGHTHAFMSIQSALIT